MTDMTLINSWLLYKWQTKHLEIPKRKEMSLCEFKLKTADSLLLGEKVRVRRGKGQIMQKNQHTLPKRKLVKLPSQFLTMI